jgi:hypothetical protein
MYAYSFTTSPIPLQDQTRVKPRPRPIPTQHLINLLLTLYRCRHNGLRMSGDPDDPEAYWFLAWANALGLSLDEIRGMLPRGFPADKLQAILAEGQRIAIRLRPLMRQKKWREIGAILGTEVALTEKERLDWKLFKLLPLGCTSRGIKQEVNAKKSARQRQKLANLIADIDAKWPAREAEVLKALLRLSGFRSVCRIIASITRAGGRSAFPAKPEVFRMVVNRIINRLANAGVLEKRKWRTQLEVALAMDFRDLVAQKSVSPKVIQVEPAKNGKNDHAVNSLAGATAKIQTVHLVKKEDSIGGVVINRQMIERMERMIAAVH